MQLFVSTRMNIYFWLYISLFKLFFTYLLTPASPYQIWTSPNSDEANSMVWSSSGAMQIL